MITKFKKKNVFSTENQNKTTDCGFQTLGCKGDNSKTCPGRVIVLGLLPTIYIYVYIKFQGSCLYSF